MTQPLSLSPIRFTSGEEERRSLSSAMRALFLAQLNIGVMEAFCTSSHGHGNRFSGDTRGMFGWGCGLGFAAEDEATAFAALVGDVVDLLPEADEVVHRGDDGDDGHPVDCGDGDEVDADDVAAPVPIGPAVDEEVGMDGDE